jgi:hypothetical protein
MAEVVIQVPAELKREIKRLDQSKLSLALQRAVMEILVSKSKLTRAAAGRMAKRMELSTAEELKSHNLA